MVQNKTTDPTSNNIPSRNHLIARRGKLAPEKRGKHSQCGTTHFRESTRPEFWRSTPNKKSPKRPRPSSQLPPNHLQAYQQTGMLKSLQRLTSSSNRSPWLLNIFGPVSGSSSRNLPTEEPDLYGHGGFHRVSLEDTFQSGKYTVMRKIGYGQYSTVWLARDSK